MWNDLDKEEPPTYLEITCVRHSFENVLIWETVWLGNRGIQEVRAGGSVQAAEESSPLRLKESGDDSEPMGEGEACQGLLPLPMGEG